MKKTLLAAALAVGFAGVAQAQTSVTLYGVVDGGMGYTKIKNNRTATTETRTGLHQGVQNGNRWGLRGSEDLGGGLKAIFQLESGFGLATGAGAQGITKTGVTTPRLFGREASLGLTSDAWGTVKLGRHTNFASRYVGSLIVPHGDAYDEGHVGNSFTSTGTLRMDNLITYETSEFSGFQAGLGYSFNVSDAQPVKIKGMPRTNATAVTVGLRYGNGPLAVAASYDTVDVLTAGDNDIKSWALATSYDFDIVKLHLGFGQDKNGALGGSVGFGHVHNSYKTNNYGLGVSVPLNAGSQVTAGWHSSRLGGGAFKTAALAAGGKGSQNLYTTTYTQELSKRTGVYVAATYGNGYSFDNEKVTQAIVGLRHRF